MAMSPSTITDPVARLELLISNIEYRLRGIDEEDLTKAERQIKDLIENYKEEQR